MLLLQVSNYTLPFVIGIAAIFSLATALAVFFIAKTVYKTTLPSKLAETYKANYEAEKIRGDQAEKERDLLRERARVWEAEKASLTLDYSQLSQLYARKSVILDAITGIYTNLANVAEAGRIEEYLQATGNPLQITRSRPEGSNDPHTSRG